MRHEWMITYEYSPTGLTDPAGRARFVNHDHTIDEALTGANAILRHNRPAGYVIVSIERQD